jgi:uncharacterized protein involved in cysteine biosynthesis
MLSALFKAVAQLSDPRVRRVLGRAILLASVVFIALWLIAWAGVSWFGGYVYEWLTILDIGSFWATAIGWLLSAAAVVSVLLASFLLFPAVVIVALSFLLETVAGAVESRHYPNLPPSREQSMAEGVGEAVRLATVSVMLNLLALPLYFLLSFFPPLNLFVFYGLNGYLLSREYFELVAVRRLSPAQVRQLRRAHQGYLLVAGVLVAFLLTVPIINLVTPIVAVCFMVHVFEGLRYSKHRRA